jgi:hypothetical protein
MVGSALLALAVSSLLGGTEFSIWTVNQTELNQRALLILRQEWEKLRAAPKSDTAGSIWATGTTKVTAPIAGATSLNYVITVQDLAAPDVVGCPGCPFQYGGNAVSVSYRVATITATYHGQDYIFEAYR